MWDVAVIGAGLSGLICARRLKVAGYQVCVLDKSRGLGGRMATRRVTGPIRVDHGARYWQPKTEVMDELTQELLTAKVLQPWPVSAYELRDGGQLVALKDAGDGVGTIYAAPKGMSAIARHLARDFHPDDSLLNHYRATRLERYDQGWRIGCEENKIVMAKRVAIAIPAPQAADLLEICDPTDLADTALASLRAVEYDPCLTVLAGYKGNREMDVLDPQGWMVKDVTGTSTDWIGLDSSKRSLGDDPDDANVDPTEGPTEAVIVIHSKPGFAQQYIDTGDLQPAASVLLRASARKYCSWIAQPDWFQIHRWRYAQVKTAYAGTALVAAPSLVCGGDWCIETQRSITGLEAAYLSGQSMAEKIAV